jgi:hypothetical protein
MPLLYTERVAVLGVTRSLGVVSVTVATVACNWDIQ